MMDQMQELSATEASGISGGGDCKDFAIAVGTFLGNVAGAVGASIAHPIDSTVEAYHWWTS